MSYNITLLYTIQEGLSLALFVMLRAINLAIMIWSLSVSLRYTDPASRKYLPCLTFFTYYCLAK